MEGKKWDLVSVEEIQRELTRIASTDFRAFAADQGYQAALLLAEIHKRFDAARTSQIVLGFRNFSKWVEAFSTHCRVSQRLLYHYVKAGRFLLPRISEPQFHKLTLKKREILAELAQAGRLEPGLLEASFGLTDDEFKKRAAPLLGKELPWEERLVIDSHEAAEAALIQLGNLLGYQTYTADSGRSFEGKKLSEIATLTDLPRFPTEQIERSAKRIDVIWVNNEEWPDSFFEVENTTSVTSGLQRMYQVLKFEAKLFVVGPVEVRARFSRAVSESPYKHYRHRYLFRSYHELEQMFQAALKYRKAYDRFFSGCPPQFSAGNGACT